MDSDAIWQVDLWGPMTHCARWRSLTPPPGEGDIWGRGRSQNMQLQMCPMLPPGEYKWVIQPFAKWLWSLLLLYIIYSTLFIIITEMTINNKRTECTVFSVPAGLTDACSVVAMAVWAGRTSSVTISLITRRAGPAAITDTALTGTASVTAAIHRTQLCQRQQSLNYTLHQLLTSCKPYPSNLYQDEAWWPALAGVETCQWSTTHHLDPPDLSWHGCYSDWGPAASGGQTVLVNNRNGGRLRLIASRHYYYYYYYKP